MSLKPGDRLGPYAIAELLGAGGMGEVWRAHDARLGRDVAVKVLPASLEADRDRLKRLEREARATAQLHHPAIVSVFDVGEQDGRPYVVMELLEGETLRSLLRRGPPPPAQALALARDVLDGLGAAHARGTLHRDLKPENIFVTRSGRAKILDFGLAKLRAGLAGPQDADADAVTLSASEALTGDGTVVGTAGYLSPEQVRGLPLDARSDLFAFGCVLHELLTGRRAFEGPTAADRMGAVLRDEPEALRAPDLLDERMRGVLARCLAKDPADRFGSAEEAARALEDEAVSATRAAARPDERPSRLPESRRRAVRIAAAALLAAASIGFVVLRRTRPAPIDSVAVLPLASDAGDTDLAFLADGLSEGVINRLSRVTGLRVVARTTAFRYRGRENDAVAAGREMGVRAVLSGRVTRRADTIAVQADLVDVASGAQIWGDRFTRTSATVATAPEELSSVVAERLRPRLEEADRARVARPSTRNADAYRLYVAGRFYWDKRDPANMQRARESFRQAIDADPTFALAWSGLADVFLFSGEKRTETIPQAREAATRALQLDPDLAEAHTTLGLIRMNWDFDWDGGLAELDHAIALSPSYAVAHQFRAGGLVFRGRTEEGLESARRALSLDRLSLAQNWYVGFLLTFARRPAEALEQCRAALRLVPDSHLAHGCAGAALLMLGRPAEALPELLESQRLRGNRLEARADVVRALAALGRRTEAVAEVHDIEAVALREPERSYGAAVALAAVGEREKALTFLEGSREGRSFMTFFSAVDPALDTLREEPRFRAHLARIGLADADAALRGRK